MTWPAVQVKTNFDAAGDDPKSARSEFAGNVDKFNQLQAHVSSYIQGLLDDADAAAARTTLAAQTLDATLTSLAAVSGVAGDILYASGTDAWAKLVKGSDGEVLKLASGIPSWGPGTARETAIATTSGTAHGFTGIAAGANRITVMLVGVSVSGSDLILIQIGDSGGYETTDYLTGASVTTAAVGSTAGFLLNRASGDSSLWSGSVILTREDSNNWVSQGDLFQSADNFIHASAGRGPTAMSELDRIQITRTGSDTFDAGSVNIFVE